MEFWLSFNNRQEVLRLPVPPPSFEISKGTNITVINITELGLPTGVEFWGWVIWGQTAWGSPSGNWPFTLPVQV